MGGVTEQQGLWEVDRNKRGEDGRRAQNGDGARLRLARLLTTQAESGMRRAAEHAKEIGGWGERGGRQPLARNEGSGARGRASTDWILTTENKRRVQRCMTAGKSREKERERERSTRRQWKTRARTTER